MGRSAELLLVAATFMGAINAINGQGLNDDSGFAGPAWNQKDYETSPPVYPSPNTTGINWEAALAQAEAFVNQLTTEEKAYLVTGTEGPCVGNIAPIKRLNFSGICLQDGPLAIREATFASVFPAGLTVAASWDRTLAKRRGVDMALEFKGKGAHVALGPVAGPLGRSGYGGRNWEGFSPDPYLTGVLFEDTIVGMQSTGLQSCAKHYIGYEQETQRNPSQNVNGVTIEAVSSNLDDRTMHELYLWPFYNAVHGGVSSIMCSYNRINGSYGCQNSKTLNGLLKGELGFQGYVVSDWGGTHSGHDAANAGLDMDMPGALISEFGPTSPSFFGLNITKSANNGSLEMSRLDDMCKRIMTPYFQLKQTEYPPIDPTGIVLNGIQADSIFYNFTYGPANVDVRDNHEDLIRELAAAGTVLLKNVNSTLPLKNPKNIGVFGNDAGDLLDGLSFGQDSDISGGMGYEYGNLPVGGGSGTGRLSHVVTPLEAIKARAAKQKPKALVQYVLNNTLVIKNNGWSIIEPTPPEVCLVFLKTWATEGFDRTSLDVDWDGNALVNTIADNCPNTVVVTHSGGLNVLPFANHPNVTAILAAHYSGEAAGDSIVDVLWGDVNPSGKLPYTIAMESKDYAFADVTNSSALLNTSDPNAWQSDFEERLLIDYRYFDHFDQPVQYEFGHGLSYTNFSMGNVSISRVTMNSISAAPPNGTIRPGGNPALWETLYSVTLDVSNTGDIAGATVPQIYLGLPSGSSADVTPVKVLRGFEKIMLQPGEARTAAFDLTRRDISYWDILSQQWLIGQGSVSVYGGFSSRDIQAASSFVPLSIVDS